jgi:hypothetical protein
VFEYLHRLIFTARYMANLGKYALAYREYHISKCLDPQTNCDC